MSDLVKVVYDGEIHTTFITINGLPFKTDRIEGREIADWAYPYTIKNITWKGFYAEICEALGGKKSFDLVFYGPEKALKDLAISLRGLPVRVAADNEVKITYDENKKHTDIRINGKKLDTSDLIGRPIEEWVRPFSARGIKWYGIYKELSEIIGSEIYTVKFIGSSKAMTELIIERPESVDIIFENIDSKNSELSSADDGGFDYTFNDVILGDEIIRKIDSNDSSAQEGNEYDDIVFFPYDFNVTGICSNLIIDTQDFNEFIKSIVSELEDAVLPSGEYVIEKLSTSISQAISGYNNWCSIAIAKATYDKEAMPNIDYADELIYGDTMKAGYWETANFPYNKSDIFIHKLDTMRRMYTKVKGIHAVNLIKYHRDTLKAYMNIYENAPKHSTLRLDENFRFYYSVCREAIFRINEHLRDIYGDRENMSKYFMTYIKNTSPGVEDPTGRRVDMNDICFDVNLYMEEQLLKEIAFMNQDSLMEKVGFWLPFVEIAANRSMDKKANNICRASINYISNINKGIYYYIVGKLFTALCVRQEKRSGIMLN